jgi:spore maturation protein SpmA
MKDKKGIILRLLWITFLVLAVVMCVSGAVSGEAESVFRKASTICMECIGLG